MGFVEMLKWFSNLKYLLNLILIDVYDVIFFSILNDVLYMYKVNLFFFNFYNISLKVLLFLDGFDFLGDLLF